MSFGGIFEGHFGSSEGEGAAGGGIVTINGNGAANQTLVGTAGQIGVSSVAGATTFTNLGVLTFRKVGGGSYQNISIKAVDGLTISDVGTGEFDFDQIFSANWSTTNIRVYAVDFVNGNDTNLGYADATATTAGAYAAACALAGSQAKKTFNGLAAIFPKLGNNRLVEILIANGGSNTAQNYNEDIGQFLNGVSGYGNGCPAVRATGTNTTAGCVAFDGSIADVTYQGGITVTGLNVAGYNPVGASTTSLPCQLAGGGAAALPAEPAAPLGWRVRFDAATATAGLRNQCRQIAKVSGGNTIVPQTAFSNAPGNTDVFYIEQPGVTWSVAASLTGGGISSAPNGMQLSGLRCTTSLELQEGRYHFSFCGAASVVPAGGTFCWGEYTTTQFYLPPVAALGASILVGGGLRSEGAVTLIVAGGLIKLAGLVSVGNCALQGTGVLQWLAGCYSPLVSVSFRSQSLVFKGLTPLANDIGAASNITQALPRAEGGMLTVGENVFAIGSCVIENCAARPAIELQGHNIVTFTSAVSGSTGNTDVGLDLQNSIGSLVILLSTPTVTGTAGDVRLGGGQIISWAQLALTGVVDSQGNQILIVGANPTGYIGFTGAIVGGAGATVSYLADSGIVGAVNQTTAFKRPTSVRLMTRLKVATLSNTSANTITVTLYKNAAPTAMQVSIPTGSVSQFTDSAHPILFLDGDQFDLRIDDAADIGALVTMSACLEYTV